MRATPALDKQAELSPHPWLDVAGPDDKINAARGTLPTLAPARCVPNSATLKHPALAHI